MSKSPQCSLCLAAGRSRNAKFIVRELKTPDGSVQFPARYYCGRCVRKAMGRVERIAAEGGGRRYGFLVI